MAKEGGGEDPEPLGIAGSEASRFLEEAVQPLGAGALHPAGRAAERSAEEGQ